MPRRDGLQVLAELRKFRPGLPVIILTARGSEEDRVRGLKMGADDYVVKPFSRPRVAGPRRGGAAAFRGSAVEVRRVRFGRAVVDFQRREVRWSEGERGELSETETAILGFLVAQRRGPCRARNC